MFRQQLSSVECAVRDSVRGAATGRRNEKYLVPARAEVPSIPPASVGPIHAPRPPTENRTSCTSFGFRYVKFTALECLPEN